MRKNLSVVILIVLFAAIGFQSCCGDGANAGPGSNIADGADAPAGDDLGPSDNGGNLDGDGDGDGSTAGQPPAGDDVDGPGVGGVDDEQCEKVAPYVVDASSVEGGGVVLGMQPVIRAVFSEPVRCDLLGTENIVVIDAASQRQVDSVVYCDGEIAIIKIEERLEQGAQFSLTISGIKDMCGNIMETAFDRVFNAASDEVVDTTPLKIIAVTPARDAAGVDVDTSITFTFNRDLDCASVVSGSVSITRGRVSVACEGDRVVATPESVLNYGQTYFVMIRGVRDLRGDQLAEAFSTRFKTMSVVTETFPKNGATNVPVGSEISLEFGPEIDCVKFGGIELGPVGVGLGTVSLRYECAPLYINITPLEPLAAGVEYALTLREVIGVDGNILLDSYTFTFRTSE